VSAAAALVAVAAAPAAGQEPLLWGGLKPGPHAVGYRCLYQFDHGRRYDPEFTTDPATPAADRPRPILICGWYPARKTEAGPMDYRQYLDVSADDARLADFPRRLTYYHRKMICQETVGQSPENLPPAEAAAFGRLLGTKTSAVKAAAAADGRFPVVIYHAGLSGTHVDNSALFEYLASHGYVVLTSAYPDAEAYSVTCGGEMYTSFRDMEFLARYARGLAFADADRLAAVGHSYGGWAVIGWAAEPGSPLSAFVTLDSGMEYVTVEAMGDQVFPHHMTVNGRNIRAASLRVASRERKANFDHLDSYLRFAPRYEATVAGLTHNDYCTHAAIRPALMPEKWPDAGKARRRGYDRVCEHVLHFLNATLKGQAAARQSLERGVRGEGLDDGFRLRFKPPAPPHRTARQLSQLIRRHGAEKAVELLRAENGAEAARSFPAAAVDVLVKDGDGRLALSVLNLFEKVDAKDMMFQLKLAEARALTGDRAGAVAAYRTAARLLPDFEKARGPRPVYKYLIEQGLKELGESEPPKKD
jgi:hypothetical protein